MAITESTNILPRGIVIKIEPWLERDEIIVILGARQVGKTSLLRYLQAKLESSGTKTFLLDFEDIELRDVLRSPRTAVSHLEALGWSRGERCVVFADEFHLLADAPSTLKYLHDHQPELKFIVTGSSSLKLKFRTGEPLTGRKVSFVLRPLSFGEYLEFTDQSHLHAVVLRAGAEPVSGPLLVQLREAFEEYVIYGGYPKVALSRTPEMKTQALKEVQTTYLEREVRSLVDDRGLARFRSFVEFLAAQNAGLVSIADISRETGIARATVQRYLMILEETFITDTLPPLARNRQKELTKMPKLHFLDTGFLNYTLKDFRTLRLRADAGTLFESAVYAMLRGNLADTEELRYWRTRAKDEVDMVLRQTGRLVPIEVKWSDRREVPSGLKAFLRGGAAREGIVVTRGETGSAVVGRHRIRFLPPWALKAVLWGGELPLL